MHPIEPIHDLAQIAQVINEAAMAYRGVIPSDRWHEPYMPMEELHAEIAAGVQFWAMRRDGRVAGVMGLQRVLDVSLIRHAYTRTADQGSGIGGALLDYLKRQSDRRMLVGTWKAAAWAIRFYERRGFRLVDHAEKEQLLRRYWSVPERQIEESVVLSGS